MSKLIILSGRSGVGKSTLANRLRRSGRGRVVNVGDVVWEAVVSNGFVPRSRTEAGVLFMEHFGAPDLTNRIARLVERNRDLVIDGLRVPDVWSMLVQSSMTCSHIHVEVPDEVRLDRLLERDGNLPIEEPFENEIDWLRSRASLVLIDPVWPEGISDSFASRMRLRDASTASRKFG